MWPPKVEPEYHVEFNVYNSAIIVQGQPVQGITRVAKRAFYPRCDRLHRVPTGRNRTRAKARGNSIDQAVSRWVTTGQLTSNIIPLYKFVVQQNGWKPVATQVPVGALSPVRIGTMLDLVCITPEGKYVILEIKTGYTRGYYRTGPHYPHMAPPLGDWRNSYSSHHMLQLWISVELFLRTYPKAPFAWSQCGVFRMDTNSYLRIMSEQKARSLWPRVEQKLHEYEAWFPRKRRNLKRKRAFCSPGPRVPKQRPKRNKTQRK